MVATDAATMLERHGYHFAYVGQGGHTGVAIASLRPISDEQVSGGSGDEHLAAEPTTRSGWIVN